MMMTVQRFSLMTVLLFNMFIFQTYSFHLLQYQHGQHKPPSSSCLVCSAISPISESSATTDETSNKDAANDDENMDILWEMAGRTAQKKRKRARKKQQTSTTTSGGVTITKSRSYNKRLGGNKQQQAGGSREPSISAEEIASVSVIQAVDDETGQQKGQKLLFMANVTLTNGTQLVTYPKDFHQRDDKHLWLAVRSSLDVTASEFSAVVGNSIFSSRDAMLQKKVSSLNRRRQNNNQYIPSKPRTSRGIEWGLKMEPHALSQYCQVTGNQVNETGLHISFVESDDDTIGGTHTTTTTSATEKQSNRRVRKFGASPDGLVIDQKDGSKGLLEIKSLWGRRHKKELPQFENCPNRFYDQIQGQLAVCNNDNGTDDNDDDDQINWCDLMMYIPPTGGTTAGKNNRKNYCIIRVERNRDYWSNTLLPALLNFCNDVDKSSV